MVAKVRELLTNGTVKPVLKWAIPVAALIFAAGKLWGKISAIEGQLSALTLRVNDLFTHLLGAP
jgi:hypothetical protein